MESLWDLGPDADNELYLKEMDCEMMKRTLTAQYLELVKSVMNPSVA